MSVDHNSILGELPVSLSRFLLLSPTPRLTSFIRFTYVHKPSVYQIIFNIDTIETIERYYVRKKREKKPNIFHFDFLLLKLKKLNAYGNVKLFSPLTHSKGQSRTNCKTTIRVIKALYFFSRIYEGEKRRVCVCVYSK